MEKKLKRLKRYYGTWLSVAQACNMTSRNLLNLRKKVENGEPISNKNKRIIINGAIEILIKRRG